jgi:hypothetical protein
MACVQSIACGHIGDNICKKKQNYQKFMFTHVSPSDDDLLDLAECINEKGPGPISNSRRFQGLPTLIIRREHGHWVPCDPRQVTRVLRCHSPPSLSPPSGQAGQRPSTPLQRAYLSPRQTTHLGPASEKPHFGLQIWIRGHGSDTRWPWRAFLAKQHFSTRSGSWASD